MNNKIVKLLGDLLRELEPQVFPEETYGQMNIDDVQTLMIKDQQWADFRDRTADILAKCYDINPQTWINYVNYKQN